MTWNEILAICQTPGATPDDFRMLTEIGRQTENPEGKEGGKLGHSVTRSNGITYYKILAPQRWLVGPKT